MVSLWENIHAQRTWGKYPNEELVRFVGRNYLYLSKENKNKLSVLEIGVGQGANLWFLAKEGFSVFGFDISYSAIRKAKKHLKEFNIPDASMPALIVADVREGIPFKTSFDLILDSLAICCCTYTEHFTIYRSIYNALKPAGVFWSMHVLKNSWGYGSGKEIDKDTFEASEGPFKGLGAIHYADLCDLVDMIRCAGFRIQSKEIILRTYQNMAKQVCFALIAGKKPEIEYFAFERS